MPSFNDILNNRKSGENFSRALPNVVVKLGKPPNELTFAKHEPDTGLVVPELDQVLDQYATIALTVNHLNSSTSFPATSLTLLNINGYIFNQLLLKDDNFFTGKEINVFLGFKNAGMDFSDYRKEPRFKLDKINQKSDGLVKMSLSSFVNVGNKSAFNFISALDSAITAGQTTATFIDINNVFPNAGFFLVDDELVSYSNKTPLGNDLFEVNIVRTQFQSINDAHNEETEIQYIEVIEAHPVDIILRLLTSTGTGINGIYDVLADGGNIDINDLDLPSFQAVKTSSQTDKFRLFTGQISSVLKYVETELLKPNNYRLVITEKITLVKVLNSFEGIKSGNITDDDIKTGKSDVSIAIDSRKIINVIGVKWNKTPDGRFLKFSQITIPSSVEVYGEKPETIEIAGAQNDLLGSILVIARGFTRGGKFGFNQGELTLKTQSKPGQFLPGDFIELDTALLSSPETHSGYFRVVEITSNKYDHIKGTCSISIADTPWTIATRIARIQADPKILTVTSQTEFIVPIDKKAEMQVGHSFRLKNFVTNTFPASGDRLITEITGDVIKIASAFSITATTDHRLYPTKYDNTTDAQKKTFGHFSDGNNDFSDGGKPYVFSAG